MTGTPYRVKCVYERRRHAPASLTPTTYAQATKFGGKVPRPASQARARGIYLFTFLFMTTIIYSTRDEYFRELEYARACGLDIDEATAYANAACAIS